MSWIVTMRHFGQDFLTYYTGEMFDPSNEGLELFRMYSKKNQTENQRVRKEKQGYPNRPLGEAFMDMMKEDADDEYDGGHF